MMKTARQRREERKKMIDIHCHVLFDADDGATDIKTSIEMCKIASNDGVKAIIATPHFIVGENNEKDILKKISVLKEILKDKKIDIEIFPGNEIFIDYDIDNILSVGECYSLNNSRYVLVEFPMMEVPNFSADSFYELQIKGYIPIIAHPERNRAFQGKLELLHDFVSNGCLAQINSSSIMGIHGERAKKMALSFLKHNLVHFVASDAHSTDKRPPLLSSSRDIVKAIFGSDRAEDIYSNNPNKVIRNEQIIIKEPIPMKKHIFQRLFSHAK